MGTDKTWLNILIVGLLMLLALSIFQYAHATCVPENTWHIPPSRNIQANAISQKSFDSAINKVEKGFGKVVEALGYHLQFNRLWNDGTVNSDTYEEGTNWIINSYGGLARYPGMNTVAAYALVACHELGHHMGGAPLYTGDDWAAVEGEADYWATKECMKSIGYSQGSVRSASLALAKVLADLGGEAVPSPFSPSKTVKRTTEEDHPPAQCRLDTYLGGFACDKRGMHSKNDAHINACYVYPTSKTYSTGSRPRCWFAP